MSISEEFQRGVEYERERIFKALHKCRAEGLELVHISSYDGINKSAVQRFDTNELVRRLKEDTEFLF